MKPLIFLFLAANLFAGPKADKIKQLSDVRNDTLEKQRIEVDKKYLAELEKLLAALPKEDLIDQLDVQKEIWKTRFLGQYYQKDNKDFRVNILRDGIAYELSGKVGNWEILEEKGKYVFHVYFGDWSFSLPADQTGNYDGGTRYFKGKPQGPDGFMRRK